MAYVLISLGLFIGITLTALLHVNDIWNCKRVLKFRTHDQLNDRLI